MNGRSHAPCGDCDAMATARVRRGGRARAGAKRARACESEGAAARGAATGGARERAAAAAAARNGVVVKPRADIRAEERTAVTASQAGHASHARPVPARFTCCNVLAPSAPGGGVEPQCAMFGPPRSPAGARKPVFAGTRVLPAFPARQPDKISIVSVIVQRACLYLAQHGARPARRTAAATVQADSSALCSPRPPQPCSSRACSTGRRRRRTTSRSSRTGSLTRTRVRRLRNARPKPPRFKQGLRRDAASAPIRAPGASRAAAAATQYGPDASRAATAAPAPPVAAQTLRTLRRASSARTPWPLCCWRRWLASTAA